MDFLTAAVTQASCTLNGKVVPCEELTNTLKHVVGFSLLGLCLVLLAVLCAIIVWLWMMIHAINHPVEHKAVWILIMLLTGIIGAVIYYLAVKRPLDVQSRPISQTPPQAVPQNLPQ
jgi:hypothetical protein